MPEQSQSVSSYLGGQIAAPENLTAVFTHIDELLTKIRSSHYNPQVRLASLLAGSSTQAVFACFVQGVYPAFVDVTGVDRTPHGIKNYLERLIMPDEAEDAHALVLEYLNVDDFDQLCFDLSDLNESYPTIVTALLEMRIGTAQRLMAVVQAEAENRAETEFSFQFDTQLLTEMTRIRIAYRLRCVAMKSAAQIHAPFAWNPLDGLEHAGIGGCLRVRTLINRLKFDLDLVKAAVNCFAAPFGDTAQFLSLSLFSVSRPRYNRTAPDDRGLTLASLEPRARLQLAIWQAKHGAALPNLLDQVMGQIAQWLVRFEEQLAAFKVAHGANAIVGDLNRARSGEQLYLAVREAIAWAKSPKNEEDVGADECAITAALRTAPDSSLPYWGYTMPRLHHEDASSIDELFMVYRFAFLQDNEVLPLELRKVKSAELTASNKMEPVKTHDRAAAIRGSRYTFLEQWSAWRREVARKVDEAERKSKKIIAEAKRQALLDTAKATQKQFSVENKIMYEALTRTQRMAAQGRQIDLMMKRGVWSIIKKKSEIKLGTHRGILSKDADGFF